MNATIADAARPSWQRLRHETMRNLFEDIRYGLRQMIKNPAFTAIAIVTLALGSGANTAIFSVINSALLQPLPYPQAGQLVQIFETNPDTERNNVSGGAFKDWYSQSHSFNHLAIFETIRRNVSGSGSPENVKGLAVSSEFLSVLGVAPTLGRDFMPGEDRNGGNNRVIILTHQFWQGHFAGDPHIVGVSISLDQVPFTIVGVLPARALLEDEASFLVPDVIDAPGAEWSRAGHWRSVIGRMAPGVTALQVQTELRGIKERLASEYPDFKQNWSVAVVPMQTVSTEDSRSALMILLAAVWLVLLISCVNVSNLLLARGNGRSREMAVRIALGAGTGRLIRQLLVESILLAIAGCAAGWMLAVFAVRLLTNMVAGMLPLMLQPKLDTPVLLVSLGVACGCGILFGILPALRASHPDLTVSLKEKVGSSGVATKRFQSLLVVSEFAVTLMLLVGAGLLVRSFIRVMEASVGFRPQHTVAFDLSLPEAKYPKDAQRLRFIQSITQRLAAAPGIASVGSTTSLPFGEGGRSEFASRSDQPGRMDYTVACDFVSPDYFAAMGMPILHGRAISEADNREKAARVLVVDTKVAHDLYPGTDAIGQHMLFLGESWEIVGIVSPVRHYSLDRPSLPAIYGPQSYSAATTSIVIRSALPPSAVAAAIRETVRSLAPDQPIANLRTLEEAMQKSLAPRRSILVLMVLFAAIATVLASIGIYGVISYATSQRTRELAIRAALGAQRQDIIRLVVSDGLKVAILGSAIGVAASFALSRFVESQLYEVSTHDPIILSGAVLLLLLIAAISIYLPARWAAYGDPITGLRYE
jgi:predicted permease